jgi:GPCR-chaperone
MHTVMCMQVWKRGSWLRVDSTIAGYSKRLRVERGAVSMLLQGTDSDAPGAMLKIDHKKKKVSNLSLL